VAAVQQALIDLGFLMPISTKRFGVPDGIFASESTSRVWAFQKQQVTNGFHLTTDGVVGKDTMARLDALLPLPHSAPSGLPFTVPGVRVLLAQPTTKVCSATVYAMMRSWKFQMSFGIREGAAAVAEKYGAMVDRNEVVPPGEFGPFIMAAQN
jgi:hypothetical protein